MKKRLLPLYVILFVFLISCESTEDESPEQVITEEETQQEVSSLIGKWTVIDKKLNCSNGREETETFDGVTIEFMEDGAFIAFYPSVNRTLTGNYTILEDNAIRFSNGNHPFRWPNWKFVIANDVLVLTVEYITGQDSSTCNERYNLSR